MLRIRPAQPEDGKPIVDLWHSGWHDAHARLVPRNLLDFRTIAHFRLWLECSADRFHVALRADDVVGFVATRGAEVVKLYVARDARGTRAASMLLSHGEADLARFGARPAVLFCVAGNPTSCSRCSPSGAVNW